jgi:ADP-ribose pyrophosphatase YjhB (NUDIX family)
MSSNASILRTTDLALRVTPDPWPFATRNASAIESYWDARSAANPSLYDGRVFVLRRLDVAAGRVTATFSLERFSAFLYWRDGGLPDDGKTLDGFGSAIVRTADGAILLGRTALDTMNPGHVYLPGGFLDARDLADATTIDLDASIARELAEETGLDAARLERRPGYMVARHGRHCSLAIEYRTRETAAEITDRFARGRAGSTDGELTALHAARSLQDLERIGALPHARHLCHAILEGTV